MSVVGLIQSLLTLQIIDEKTHTKVCFLKNLLWLFRIGGKYYQQKLTQCTVFSVSLSPFFVFRVSVRENVCFFLLLY